MGANFHDPHDDTTPALTLRRTSIRHAGVCAITPFPRSRLSMGTPADKPVPQAAQSNNAVDRRRRNREHESAPTLLPGSPPVRGLVQHATREHTMKSWRGTSEPATSLDSSAVRREPEAAALPLPGLVTALATPRSCVRTTVPAESATKCSSTNTTGLRASDGEAEKASMTPGTSTPSTSLPLPREPAPGAPAPINQENT